MRQRRGNCMCAQKTLAGVTRKALLASGNYQQLTPNKLKEKELTIGLLLDLIKQAKALNSTTYLKESHKSLQMMVDIWGNDPAILAMQDMLWALTKTCQKAIIFSQKYIR